MAQLSSLRVAVVGCGPWGKNLARAFAQENALEALVDIIHPKAVEFAKQLSDDGYSQPHTYSWEEVLRNTSIDALVLASPASEHADMAISCLAAGKHVFIEKPFALSVNDAKRIKNAAVIAARMVMVGHVFQYHPAFIELKAMVQQGKLGHVQHIHSHRLAFGRIREKEDVFWSLGSHDVSMILALADDMPVEVAATGSFHLRPQVADIATANLSFASGLQADISVSWLHPQKERKLTVIGDIATAVFDDCEPWERKLCVFRNKVRHTNRILEAVQEGAETVALQVQEPLAVECRHFLDCVKGGQQPITNGEEALRVIEVLGCIGDRISQNRSLNSLARRSSPRPSIDNLSQPSAGDGQSHIKQQNPYLQLIRKREGRNLVNISVDAAWQGSITRKNTDQGGLEIEEQVPLIDFVPQKARIQDQLNFRLTQVFDHANFILGPEVRELEARLGHYSGVAHVVTCGSGTAALTLALLALGLKPGDAVLVPDLSFIATVEPIVLLGGIPVFVDVEPHNLTINPSLINDGVAAAASVGYTAVGIVAVDLYGHPADYDALHEAAAQHGVWVIGDAAQSFGGSSSGRRTGALARVTTTSFFPSKPLGCYGDGGAVFTNDGELADLLRSLRQHGLDKTKSNGLRIGLNSRLDTIQAAVLLSKLDLLTEEIIQRGKVAETYAELLNGVVVLPMVRDGFVSAWAAYTIRTKHRDAIKRCLVDHKIACAIYYAIPFHKQYAYHRFPIIHGGCPVAEHACEEVLSLPMGPYLNSATQKRISNVLKDALSQVD